eukprot:m.119475 g.119475  ORF g.119475 m.119475 type:complete len:281 (-) comp28736_c0_seq1:92-934(-)
MASRDGGSMSPRTTSALQSRMESAPPMSERMRKKNSALSIKEAQTRKEVQELQQKHVAALQFEIEDLKRENGLLADALAASGTESPHHDVALINELDQVKEAFATFQRDTKANIAALEEHLISEKKQTARENQLRLLAEHQVKLGEDLAKASSPITTSTPTNVLGDISTWMGLLQATKTLEQVYTDADAQRESELAVLRAQAVTLGEDEKTTRELLNILDGLKPTSRANDNAPLGSSDLQQLLLLEQQIVTAKQERKKLQEHLAYLDRIHRSNMQDISGG